MCDKIKHNPSPHILNTTGMHSVSDNNISIYTVMCVATITNYGLVIIIMGVSTQSLKNKAVLISGAPIRFMT